MHEAVTIMNITGSPLRFLLTRPLDGFASARSRRKKRTKLTRQAVAKQAARLSALQEEQLIDPQTGRPFGQPSPYAPDNHYPVNPASGNMPTPAVYDPGFTSPQSTLPPPPIYDAPPSAAGQLPSDVPISQEVLDEEWPDEDSEFGQYPSMNTPAENLITSYSAFSCACERLKNNGQPFGAWLDNLNSFAADPPTKRGFIDTAGDVATTYFTSRQEAAAAKAKAKASRPVVVKPSGPSPLWIGVGVLGALLIVSGVVRR